MFGLNNYFHTSTAKKSKHKPFIFSGSTKKACEIIETKLKTMGLLEVKVREEYGDIFAQYDGFEMSFQLVYVDGQNIINLSVYCDDRHRKTKKLFYQLYNEFMEVFPNK